MPELWRGVAGRARVKRVPPQSSGHHCAHRLDPARLHRTDESLCEQNEVGKGSHRRIWNEDGKRSPWKEGVFALKKRIHMLEMGSLCVRTMRRGGVF